MTSQRNPNEFDDTEYELLVKEIYEYLNKQQVYPNIEIMHNIKLAGKSGCEHQIDVYWKFQSLGIVHQVAIECKNYNSKVPVGKVRDFYGVVSDINGLTGIMVSKMGFQSGAIEYARAYGINLQEARMPTDDDFKGRIKTIHLEIVASFVELRKLTFHWDNVWKDEQIRLGNLKVGGHFQFDESSDKLFVRNSNGEPIKSMYQLEKELPRGDVPVKNREHNYDFEDGYLVDAHGTKMKISQVAYIYDVIIERDKKVIAAKNLARAILRDVQSGEIKFIKYDKKKKEEPKGSP